MNSEDVVFDSFYGEMQVVTINVDEECISRGVPGLPDRDAVYLAIRKVIHPDIRISVSINESADYYEEEVDQDTVEFHRPLHVDFDYTAPLHPEVAAWLRKDYEEEGGNKLPISFRLLVPKKMLKENVSVSETHPKAKKVDKKSPLYCATFCHRTVVGKVVTAFVRAESAMEAQERLRESVNFGDDHDFFLASLGWVDMNAVDQGAVEVQF